jgi:hypothetical protein
MSLNLGLDRRYFCSNDAGKITWDDMHTKLVQKLGSTNAGLVEARWVSRYLPHWRAVGYVGPFSTRAKLVHYHEFGTIGQIENSRIFENFPHTWNVCVHGQQANKQHEATFFFFYVYWEGKVLLCRSMHPTSLN